MPSGHLVADMSVPVHIKPNNESLLNFIWYRSPSLSSPLGVSSFQFWLKALQE